MTDCTCPTYWYGRPYDLLCPAHFAGAVQIENAKLRDALVAKIVEEW